MNLHPFFRHLIEEDERDEDGNYTNPQVKRIQAQSPGLWEYAVQQYQKQQQGQQQRQQQRQRQGQQQGQQPPSIRRNSRGGSGGNRSKGIWIPKSPYWDEMPPNIKEAIKREANSQYTDALGALGFNKTKMANIRQRIEQLRRAGENAVKRNRAMEYKLRTKQLREAYENAFPPRWR